MRKGSITIFSSLSLLLVVAVLFSLLEGTRFQEMKRISQLQTELAVESFFAEYNSNLWERYHLLGSDGTEIRDRLLQSGNARQITDGVGLNLLQTTVKDVNIEGYTLITDGEGAAFVYAVSSYMENHLLYETAKSIYNQYEAMKQVAESSDLDMTKIDEALESIEAVQNTQKARRTIVTNPMHEVKNLQQAGILELVIQDCSQLSKTQIDVTGLVSNRVLKTGQNAIVPTTQWEDSILFQQYLLSYFSNYLNSNEGTYLSYEIEYLIGGKSSDIENLKEVVQQLLILRELANFLYLMSDVEKKEEARLLALTLAGATVNPIIIETVRMGILTAWAFGESVLDVRALLCGKKIPLLKSKELWTTNLIDLGMIGQDYQMAKESSWGLSYEQYLGILLLFRQETQNAMRAMDIQEITIRNKDNLSNFKMDTLLIETRISLEYDYHPIFVLFQADELYSPWKSYIKTKAEYSYN